jgi:8-oxo-dGTP pyrophosphatase MutT (NUDIX family)
LRLRVLAYVTRERDGVKELLVFDHRDHPEAGTQVPAGRADRGETLEQVLRRELAEEAGLEDVEIVREVPILGDWASRSRYDNHAFEVSPIAVIPDTFDHVVRGDGDDAGLVFRYRWEPLRPGLSLWGGDDPTWTQLA